jgi:hypothetical protein
MSGIRSCSHIPLVQVHYTAGQQAVEREAACAYAKRI